MKCDRRWYYDGRYERALEDAQRKQSTRPEADEYRQSLAREFHLSPEDIEVYDNEMNGFHAVHTPKGERLRITLPEDGEDA